MFCLLSETKYFQQIVSSQSCGIELGEFFIITGGAGSRNIPINDVSKYSRAGWVLDLTELNTARRSHACSKYRDGAGHHVLLVTGGYGASGSLSSTEISEDQGVVWNTIESAALPNAKSLIRAVTYNNRLLVFGIIIRSDH